jgi:protein TonB
VEAPKVIAVPVRVGGNVRSPRLVKRVEPEYPLLAKASRIKGAVRLEAILTEEGKVSDLKLVSGHPLLIESAMKAARQWEYEPTYLNDIPARVILYITVNFTLQF